MSLILSLYSNKEEVAHGMRQWHKALGKIRSSAQLSLCIQHLQKSFVWKQDFMKVVGVFLISLFGYMLKKFIATL